MAEVEGEVLGFIAGKTLKEAKRSFDSELTVIYLEPSVERAGIGRKPVAPCDGSVDVCRCQ